LNIRRLSSPVGFSEEVVSIVSAYLAGQTGTMEFATTMEKVRLQRSTPVSISV
jgi:hypothetical protein